MARRRRSSAGNKQASRREPTKPTPAPTNPTRIPHDPVNEIVVISAVLVDPEVAKKYLPTIPSDSFFGQGHAAAWATLQEIQRRGLSYDPATVRQLSGGSVDPEVLEEYARDRPRVPPNLRHHIDCLHWDRVRLEAVRGPVAAFLEGIRNPATDPARVRALARSISDSFQGAGATRYLRDPQEVVRAHSLELTERRTGRAIYPYGIPGLDQYGEDCFEVERGKKNVGDFRLIPGAAPKKVTVVAGLSGAGKTTTTAQIALMQAKQKRRTLFGAWEQGAGATLETIAVLSLGMSRECVQTGDFNEIDQQEIEAEMERLGEWIRFFELPFGRARGEREFNDRNLDLIQEHIAETAPDLFIADLFRRALKETKPDDEEQALYRMQAITQEQACHSILVHQLRLKDVETREDKRPTRESVKGSSGWIDVADTLIAWHRPGLFKRMSEQDETIQALILKQRYVAWPLAVELDFNPVFGWADNGRGIAYDQPGDTADNDSLEAAALAKQWGKRR